MIFNGFEILNGARKILISAPHAVEQTREGKIKLPEPVTGQIARELNKLGFSAIIKTENLGDDANYDLCHPYKQALLEYCKENNICFVVDLHQLSYKREMDFCLGIGEENKNLLTHKTLALDLVNLASKYGFEMRINDPFSAPEKTVSGFCCIKDLPSCELEINSGLIASYCNATRYDDVFNFLLKFCENIEKEFKNENTFNK